MADVNCKVYECLHNDNGICNSESISVGLIADFFDGVAPTCKSFKSTTQKGEYTSKFYELRRDENSGGFRKIESRGKRLESHGLVFFTKTDYKNKNSFITEEKSGVIAGTVGDLDDTNKMEMIKRHLNCHFEFTRPVAEYPTVELRVSP